MVFLKLRAQSFTSFKADLSQEKNNRGFVFLIGVLMEHFLEGSAQLRLWQVNSEEMFCLGQSSHLG